jgi:hypothetical protein
MEFSFRICKKRDRTLFVIMHWLWVIFIVCLIYVFLGLRKSVVAVASEWAKKRLWNVLTYRSLSKATENRTGSVSMYVRT